MVKRPEKDVLESPRVLKELVSAHRHLATLNGRFPVLPNEKIFLSNLYLQEAKGRIHKSLFKYSILFKRIYMSNRFWFYI